MTTIPPLMSLQDLHCASMDRRSNPRNRAYWPVQFGAAYNGPNRPAAVQPQCCEQLPDPVVQGLRDALCSAISEIKSLKEENKALKEQIGLLENRQVEVSQLREELKQKDDLLQKAVKKRRARTRAHVETLELLGQLEKKLKRSEVQQSTCDALEASTVSENLQLQKLTINTKEQEQLEKKSKKEQDEKNMKEEEENDKKRKEEKEMMDRKEKVKKEGKEKMDKDGKEEMEKEEKKMEKEGKEKTDKDGKEEMEKDEKENAKKERKEKMENKENEMEEKVMRRSEEKGMNEKKEKTAKKKRGKKKKNGVAITEHPSS